MSWDGEADSGRESAQDCRTRRMGHDELWKSDCVRDHDLVDS